MQEDMFSSCDMHQSEYSYRFLGSKATQVNTRGDTVTPLSLKRWSGGIKHNYNRLEQKVWLSRFDGMGFTTGTYMTYLDFYSKSTPG